MSPILLAIKLKELILQENYNRSLYGLALTTSSLLSKNNALTISTWPSMTSTVANSSTDQQLPYYKLKLQDTNQNQTR